MAVGPTFHIHAGAAMRIFVIESDGRFVYKINPFFEPPADGWLWNEYE
jgi:hypothetical protein